MKQRLRERSEEYLRLAALEQTRRAHPAGTTAPYRARGGAFWRHVFVPVYRAGAVVGQADGHAARCGMTAKGWTPPSRTPGEPWRPPAGDRPDAGQPPA